MEKKNPHWLTTYTFYIREKQVCLVTYNKNLLAEHKFNCREIHKNLAEATYVIIYILWPINSIMHMCNYCMYMYNQCSYTGNSRAENQATVWNKTVFCKKK